MDTNSTPHRHLTSRDPWESSRDERREAELVGEDGTIRRVVVWFKKRADLGPRPPAVDPRQLALPLG